MAFIKVNIKEEIKSMKKSDPEFAEKLGRSPSLGNFIRYLDGAGLEIKIEKKDVNLCIKKCKKIRCLL